MHYNYQLSEEAESDIYGAYLWYEKQKRGLGENFLNDLDAARQAIIKSPIAYRFRYKKKVRAFVLNTFPYMILYLIDKSDINVISVFNTHQNPRTWKARVK